MNCTSGLEGDRHNAVNCRPVSLTSITCKLLEHVIRSNVMAYFDGYKILKDNPHGFRKGRSCEIQRICFFDLLLYVPSQQRWPWRDGHFT